MISCHNLNKLRIKRMQAKIAWTKKHEYRFMDIRSSDGFRQTLNEQNK